MSLFLLRSILRVQYSVLVDGIRQCFLHPCQKHESMKITVLCFGKTMSGLPKYLVEFLRYLYPRRQSSLRNATSILLSLLLTRDMISLRFFFETVSIAKCLANAPNQTANPLYGYNSSNQSTEVIRIMIN